MIRRVRERKHPPSERAEWKKRPQGRAILPLEQEIGLNVEDIEEFADDGI